MSDTSWGRPGEQGRLDQDRGGSKRGERRGGSGGAGGGRGGEGGEKLPDLRVQLQGGNRTVGQFEPQEEAGGGVGSSVDLRAKLTNQRRGGGGGEGRDLREDLQGRRGEVEEERALSPREQQRKTAAEERERLRNRARGGGGAGGQRGQGRGGVGGQVKGQHARQNGREEGGRGQENGGEEHGQNRGGERKHIPRPKKNTENFNPCHDAPPLRYRTSIHNHTSDNYLPGF